VEGSLNSDAKGELTNESVGDARWEDRALERGESKGYVEGISKPQQKTYY